MDKENKNFDEISQKLNGLAQKLQEEKIEFTYKYNEEWVPQEVEKVSVALNTQMLNFNISGSDPYGTWNQMGVITISKSNQVETFSRKLYDNSYLHGGDVLIYYGQYDEQIQTFIGNWYCNNTQGISYTTYRVRTKEIGLQNLKVNESQYLSYPYYKKDENQFLIIKKFIYQIHYYESKDFSQNLEFNIAIRHLMNNYRIYRIVVST